MRPSYSPWSSPIWVVPKKLDSSGKQKWRIVVDYRKLNEKTIGDRYPLPNIEDILDKLGRSNYFTTLDLASGYYQIEMDEESISKTAFSCEKGHYEFVRMPMGIKNAPSSFQRTMDNVLRGVENVLVYLDDIIVYSTSLEEHLVTLKKVFERLRESRLKIQLDKTEFLCKEVGFLGHIVTPQGVKPNPNKIRAITEYPIPRTAKQIKSFLGLIGYYRKFIRDFAEITKPMTKCLKKNAIINIHDPDYKESFQLCKEVLTNDPILQYPDFSKSFILTTDASNVAIGAVLSQGKVGSDLPVAYASRTLNETESKYSAIEKELLAIVFACKYFRPYLFGREFLIVTDHRPLQWLFSLKEPNSKLVRWRLKIEEYQYKIVYKKGILNKNADALSRVEINTNSVTERPKEYRDEIQSIVVEADSNTDENDIDDLVNQTTDNNINLPSMSQTVHSSAENPIVEIPIAEGPVNVGSNQIIISEVNYSQPKVTRKFLHGDKRQRIFVQFTRDGPDRSNNFF